MHHSRLHIALCFSLARCQECVDKVRTCDFPGLAFRDFADFAAELARPGHCRDGDDDVVAAMNKPIDWVLPAVGGGAVSESVSHFALSSSSVVENGRGRRERGRGRWV
jgi:hypothetical protein